MAQMSMTESPEGAANVRVGQIIGRTFGVLGRHIVPFSIMTAIPLAPFVLLGFLLVEDRPTANNVMSFALIGAAAGLLYGVLFLITQAVILFGTFQDMRGKPVRFGESVTKGLARFLPIIGVAICALLALIAGFILFVIPGVMLMLAFYVAIPVCVVEGCGPVDSLKRSAALTKGHRGKLLGILLLVGIIGAICSAVISAILGVVGGTLVLGIGRFIWQAVFGAFTAVLTAVIYHDLRAAKEGIDVERMAAVFD